MLTGDSPNCAKAIAKQLNLDDFRAGVLPEDKASYIESLKKEGNTVVMVTHNDALQNMADRVVKLRDGKIRKNFVNETKIPAAELEW